MKKNVMGYTINNILTTHIVAFVLMCCIQNTTKAQIFDSDPISGIYLDDVRVDTVLCGGFGKMRIVFPLSERENWSKYDFVEVNLYWNVEGEYIDRWITYRFSPAMLNFYFPKEAKCGVWMPLKDSATDKLYFENGSISGDSRKTLFSRENSYFQFEVAGINIIGYDRVYDKNGTFFETPKYDIPDVLYKSKVVPIKMGSLFKSSEPFCASGAKTQLLFIRARTSSDEIEYVK